jgi:hypothetical protein
MCGIVHGHKPIYEHILNEVQSKVSSDQTNHCSCEANYVPECFEIRQRTVYVETCEDNTLYWILKRSLIAEYREGAEKANFEVSKLE